VTVGMHCVLEHCMDPVSALKNIRECIGTGHLLIAVSIKYVLHMLPDDYYRFTQEFWRVVEMCEFEIIDKDIIRGKGLDGEYSEMLTIFCRGDRMPKVDLSVLIPSRNEMFLAKTIENVLSNIRGDTEIIAVCDGSWPDPPIQDDPRVTLIHVSKPIGQRAATNEAARLSRAKFIMKLDAHCKVDEGFDIKLMADIQYDWTIVPACTTSMPLTGSATNVATPTTRVPLPPPAPSVTISQTSAVTSNGGTSAIPPMMP